MRFMGMNKKALEFKVVVIIIIALVLLILLLIFSNLNFNWINAIADKLFGY